MSVLWSDLRLAVRVLMKAPGFSLAAIVALALGIGPNTAIFSVVYATLLAPLPYPQPEQLVMVWSQPGETPRNSVSAGDYLEWKEHATSFQYLTAFTSRELNLATPEAPERVRARLVSADGHRLLGEGVWLGRDFRADEDEPGRNRVVLLSHRLWRERYGADRDIIGRQIRLDSVPHTVIGVLPPGTSDRLPAELWVPLAFTPEQINHDFHWLLVMGRLKDGVTLEQAQQELDVIAGDLAERFPQSNTDWGVSVEPLQNNFLSEDTQANLWLLLAAVSFVVLIACVNVANLLLARGTARNREMAIRASLGASQTHLFRQVLTESLVLAAVGGTLGVLLSMWILQGILAILPPFTLPSEADPRLNLPVLLFTVLATAVSGLLFGSVPAWQAGRIDLNETLKHYGRTAVAGSRRGLPQALVVAEFALAVTLLAGAGLTIYSFWKRTQVDLGVRADHLLTFGLPVNEGKLSSARQIGGFYRQLLDKLAAVPGVAHVSVSTGLPVFGDNFGMQFTLVGQEERDPGARPGARFNMVTPDYFKTLGIRLLRGRRFTDQDAAGGVRVALVNERFVDDYLDNLDPLRQRLLIEELIPGVQQLGPRVEWHIVGIVSDANNGGPLGDRAAPGIYVPFWQSPWPQVAVAVRTATDPNTMRQSLASAVSSLDPELPLDDVRTMEQIVGERLAPDRLNIALYSGLAGVALLLAALGIYGVMTFTVARRTSEIGLRMALGAGRSQVLLRILREGLVLAAGGLILGLIGAYALGRTMQGLLYGTDPLNVPVLLVTGLVLLGAASLACYLPARRASTVDPVIALRQE